jgi:predicted DCC family thiol-disulfide oxidoreductase YuxK
MSDPLCTVLYDGGCPLCGREIGHYRRFAGDLPIRWVDVAPLDADPAPTYGVSRLDALKVFHVIDAGGAVHRGARAFVALWALLPRYRWLARACRALRVESLLDAVYFRFAERHFARRCRDGVRGADARIKG